MACLLPHVALHPRYDAGSVPLAGFSPFAGSRAPLSAHDCQALCEAHNRCIGWTHRAGVKSRGKDACWLVSRDGGRHTTTSSALGFTSGLLSSCNVTRRERVGSAPALCAVSKLAGTATARDLRRPLPRISLACSTPGLVISRVVFASYGRPSGLCLPDGSTPRGIRPLGVSTRCHAPRTAELARAACIGRERCAVSVNTTGAHSLVDPCPGKIKRLAVRVACAPASSSSASMLVPKDEGTNRSSLLAIPAAADADGGQGASTHKHRRRQRRGGTTGGGGPTTWAWAQTCGRKASLRRGDSTTRSCESFCSRAFAKRRMRATCASTHTHTTQSQRL